MRCKKCRQYRFEYMDNTLPSEQSNLIREHLDSCPACRAVYALERELSRDFHETTTRLGERFHFQFRQPASWDRPTDPVPNWASFPVVKWAAAAILLAVLIVCARLLIFRPSETQSDRTARVTAPGAALRQLTQPGRQSENEEGVIQIISIEGASGQLDETHFRWEMDGLTAEITVEVSAPRVVRKSKG